MPAKKSAKSKTKTPKITKEMTIGKVMELKPEAADVMLSYGLHCVGCSVNLFETIEQGATGHGIPAEEIDEMVKAINEVKPGQVIKKRRKAQGVFVTKTATDKIKELAKEEEKDGWGLKIQVIGQNYSGFQYYMDFAEKKDKEDKKYTFDDVDIYIDKESNEKLEGAMIDYVVTEYGEGFNIINDNSPGDFGGESTEGCCGGGAKKNGGCGC